MKRIKVIGGGYSGLVQAYYLVQEGFSVEVLEKESRLGGLLGSEKRNGFLMEQAANAFIANADLEEIANTIGVVLNEKTTLARRRFIYRDGHMKRWPLNLIESLPLVGFLAFQKWKKQKFSPKEAESFYDWSLRNLGEGATQYLANAGLQGIYATSGENLSAELLLASLKRKSKKGRLMGSVSPQGGMQEWLDKMESYLVDQGVVFSKGVEVEEFDFSQPHILAVGLGVIKQWQNQQKVNLPESLRSTELASLTSVTLTFNDSQQKLNEGFGCLFPSQEGFYSLGVLFNHSIFDGRVPAEAASETWILNDEKMEFSQMSRQALLRYILSDRSQLKTWVEPNEIKVAQWPGRIPIYNEALRVFHRDLAHEKPPFLLVGNYLGDLGLSKIILKAQQNVKKIKEGYFA